MCLFTYLADRPDIVEEIRRDDIAFVFLDEGRADGDCAIGSGLTVAARHRPTQATFTLSLYRPPAFPLER